MFGRIKGLFCLALMAVAVSASAFVPEFRPLESAENVNGNIFSREDEK